MVDLLVIAVSGCPPLLPCFAPFLCLLSTRTATPATTDYAKVDQAASARLPHRVSPLKNSDSGRGGRKLHAHTFTVIRVHVRWIICVHACSIHMHVSLISICHLYINACCRSIIINIRSWWW